MKRVWVLALVALVLVGCASKTPPLRHQTQCLHYYDLKREQCLTLETAAERLARYEVIFVGDHHDQARWHAEVARLVEALHRRGYRVVLANEWFTPGDNELLARYVAGAIDAQALQEAIGWSARVGFGFESFGRIYDAVKKSGGTLYGINLSKAQRQSIRDANLSGMDEALRRFYEGLDLGIGAHRALVAPYMQHCEGAQGCEARMYRVQAAWDQYMAQEVSKIAEGSGAQDRLIVFAGSMHMAYHLGINLHFARVSPCSSITLLPMPRSKEGYEIGYADMLYLYDDNASSSASAL
ncbi:MAG: ChaN family lipoprotein [Campylobacterales bacterium]|nr:ChaN family lipoprotein [Campylobacterales bacterium]